MDCQIVVAVVTDLYDCKTAQDVAHIPAPKENCLIGFEGSSIFILALVLRNTILASGSGKNQPFELIPIVTDAARNFGSDHEEDETMTSLTLSYPCRQPQCMALQCQRGLDQQNQIPNKTLRHGNHDFLQGTSKAMHQRGIRNLSYTGQQISDQSTCQLIQPNANAFKSSELYDYKKQPHRSAHPHVQGSGHRWQLQQPVLHPLP